MVRPHRNSHPSSAGAPNCSVGIKIVRIRGQFFAKGLGRSFGIAGPHQSKAVEGIEIGQFRIQCDGFAQILQSAREIVDIELSSAQKKSGFGGIAVAKNLVDHGLAPRDLVIPNAARYPACRRYLGRRGVPERKDREGRPPVLFFPIDEPAIGQQHSRLQLIRHGLVHLFKNRRGLVGLGRSCTRREPGSFQPPDWPAGFSVPVYIARSHPHIARPSNKPRPDSTRRSAYGMRRQIVFIA